MKTEEIKEDVFEFATGSEPRPIDDCYWIIPGIFLAGEYPRVKRSKQKSEKKIQDLLLAGVTCFIDLTEPRDDMEPYAQMVMQFSGAKVQTKRYPIRDISIPYSDEQTTQILDAIDAVIAAQGTVYLHCWGGVGRTGTIAGCWLARHGYPGDAALEKLHELWDHCPKSGHRESPETYAQEEYVRSWSE
jgi:protein-tyrosine phosphatase